MILTPGTRLGVYEVTTQIGEGGMGQVYRAHDTKLGRDVALKILPGAFANDPDRLARFQREAKTLASLNHPNIGGIYGLEESGAVTALVLELVEGEDLAQRIARGAMPIDEALPIAKQIADALEAAHEQGIIHRDLKPANIKIRPDGTVKVLDFGLAKALAPAGAGATVDVSRSPTITSPAMTQAGMILGTAAYMSPEQARGEPIDRRTDVWAFGCVLYEMLSGNRVFDRKSLSETLADVLKSEPSWDRLPADLPARISTVMHRCLEKSLQRRIRDIGDVRLVLDGAFDTALTTALTSTYPPSRWRRAAAYGATLAVGGFLGGLMLWGTMRTDPTGNAPMRRFAMNLPEGYDFSAGGRNLIAIAPDATRVVYVANRRLYMRAMDQLEGVAIRGSESGGAASHARMPFFSPDGQWIGFWQEGQIRKVPVAGGAAIPVCDTDNPFGATWNTDDTIVFGSSTNGGPAGIVRVLASGGKPELLFPGATNKQVHGPQLLPGGQAVLFTLWNGRNWDDAQIAVQSLSSKEPKILVAQGRDARYVETGHLLYGRKGSIFAVPFDVRSLEVTGTAVPVVEGVRQAGDLLSGAVHFSVARDGTLVYVPASDSTRTLVWVDRQGRESIVPVPPHRYESPRISPDGTRLAVSASDQEQDIWIWDFSRQTLSRLTSDAARDAEPVWTPDGRKILFDSHRAAPWQVFSQAVDGTTPTRLSSEAGLHPRSMTPDGQLVLHVGGGLDQYVGTMNTATGSVEPLIETRFTESNGEVSPDGRWIAFDSDESGQTEIYVRPFPAVNEGRWKISTGGGHDPLWARTGKELVYRSPDGGVMAASVDARAGFSGGTPAEVLKGGIYFASAGFIRTYDISPDGQRFLMLKGDSLTSETAFRRMIVVEHWFEELKRRVPVHQN